MNAKKLILNPKALKPAQRVTRPKGASSCAPSSVYPTAPETQAYWRGFADGAKEARSLQPQAPWSEDEIAAYRARTRGF